MKVFDRQTKLRAHLQALSAHPSRTGTRTGTHASRHPRRRSGGALASSSAGVPAGLLGGRDEAFGTVLAQPEIERGVRNPTWQVVCSLARALDTPIATVAHDAEAEAQLAHRMAEAHAEVGLS
jgi:hypothetical protein